jgi:phosphoglycerol transferase MdoB-like AlkP superfamily enzyme
VKSRLLAFIKIYVIWILVFMIQKPIFMLIHIKMMGGIGFADWFRVMWHGLTLDTAMAGYLTIIPALLLITSVWVEGRWLNKALKYYFIITSLLVSIAFIVNIALYGFWGFPLDATPMFYLLSSPKEAFASVGAWFIILGIIALAVCCVAITWLFVWLIKIDTRRVVNNIVATIALLVLTGLLIIPIRGGVTVSSTNSGKAYFSTNQRLNHAAVNPMFSFMESYMHQEDIGDQYRFMKESEANQLFKQMICTESVSTEPILNTTRPNVIIIIMESFSSKLMASLGGEKNVAVNLDRIGNEGVIFTHFFANSFRTDRGLVSILSGYPAQPSMSIMKYPHKTSHLPAIARSLVKAGYMTKYYYGGDADFTNMRSYLVSSGFTDIISDEDFPVSERLSKWGVHDHLVFKKLIDDIAAYRGNKHTLRVLQTSSSHEPFDVPYHRLSNKRLNAFAYTDACIGNFINKLRALPAWKNTLVVLVPDHLGAYPEDISNFVLDRYRIPLILSGGAVAAHRRISVIGSQQDIAATLLGQMRLPHSEFLFSKDMMSKNAPHFAFFTVPDAFGLATKDNALIYDNQSGKVMLDLGDAKGKNLKPGKAYLQKLYDDISHR